MTTYELCIKPYPNCFAINFTSQITRKRYNLKQKFFHCHNMFDFNYAVNKYNDTQKNSIRCNQYKMSITCNKKFECLGHDFGKIFVMVILCLTCKQTSTILLWCDNNIQWLCLNGICQLFCAFYVKLNNNFYVHNFYLNIKFLCAQNFYLNNIFSVHIFLFQQFLCAHNFYVNNFIQLFFKKLFA